MTRLTFYSPSIRRRFNDKITRVGLVELPSKVVPQADCLLWSGTLAEKGYGRFWFNKSDGAASKYRLTHRMAMEFHLSRYLREDEQVCHRCDCPACVNPDHLFLGTHKDNMDDRQMKGRSGNRMVESQAVEAMKLLAEGYSGKDIAKRLSVHFVSISDIKLGRSWAHLAGVDGNPTLYQMQTAEPKSAFVAKFDAEKARIAKLRLAAGESARLIAKSMGVSTAAIYHIKQGRTWSEIDIGVDLMALPLQPHGSRRP